MKRNHTLSLLLLILCFASCKTLSVSNGHPMELDEIRVSSPFITAGLPLPRTLEWNAGSQIQPPGIQSIEPALNASPDITFASTLFKYPENSGRETGIMDYSEDQIMLYAAAARKYAKQNGFDTTYVFLANMAVMPNKKRFYIVNLKTMSVEATGLVSHGRGKGRSIYSRQYSNVPGSNCTSLGRYKVAQSYNGSYGFSYRLVGLDKSNSNAEARGVVLHPMGCIPDKEGFAPACVSEGCPALSTSFFSGMSKIVQSKKKPVLLWIYDSLLEEPVVVHNKTKTVTQEIPAIALRTGK